MGKNILIIGPSWVGDMVMAQSLFQLLKQQDPTNMIDVLAPDWSRLLVDRMPEVRASIPFSIGHGQLGILKRYKIARQLSAQKYDQAIVLPNSFKSALVPFFARIPRRTGYLGEMRRFLINDLRTIDSVRMPMMIKRYLALGVGSQDKIPESITYPRLTVYKKDIEQVIEKFQLNFHGNA